MTLARVQKELKAPAHELWTLVEDFGRCDWIPGAKVALEGSGVGMVRVIGGAVRERLESLDAAARTLGYSIEDAGNPFPVKGYRATMRVEDAPGGSRLTWTSEFEPVGLSDDEARARIEGMYETMVGWIESALARR